MNERAVWVWNVVGGLELAATLVALAVLIPFFISLSFPAWLPVGVGIATGESMLPTMQEESTLVVYVQTGDYEPGDIVVFDEYVNETRSEPGPITIHESVETRQTIHRVVWSDNSIVQTQGDNNEIPDEPITHDQVYGEVVFYVDL
ncbi:hypothetical protein ACOZ35_03275 [Halorubrum xinjiangense]|uniref:hypothetical protein n=1 Tax=Halorubrum xinjiangense TaxID=261291 RepID=UPI003C6FAC39